ncbi:MAG: hypothetical protein JSU86_06445, partial [Phycisphaerales bacterium]
VALVATISPVVEGCTVHFKVWDVDDPFDQNNPTMPDVALIDGDASGPDNRGADPGVGTWSATTDASGEARVTVTVSMQPGNNYRAGASASEAILGATTQSDADANTPPDHVVFTDMLTVWRKLHVEVDSMAAVDWTATLSETSNAQNGEIPTAPTFDPATGTAWIPIEQLDADFHATDQHRVGKLYILTYGYFVTDRTDINQTPNRVRIINAPANIVNAAGLAYTLWDDDVGSDPNGAPPFIMVGFDAPPVTLPKILDTSLMAQVFQNAYVDVQPPDMQYYDPNTPFDRNIEESEAADTGAANRDLTSEAAYWVVHITSAFQGYVDKDGDPDTEQGAEGLQYGVTGARFLVGSPRSGSLIYLETIRDDKRANPALMGTMERYTVAHEGGHQFLLEHADGYCPPGDDQDPTGDYIMTDTLDQTGMAPNVAFSAASLKKIRSAPYPPQGD